MRNCPHYHSIVDERVGDSTDEAVDVDISSHCSDLTCSVEFCESHLRIVFVCSCTGFDRSVHVVNRSMKRERI